MTSINREIFILKLVNQKIYLVLEKCIGELKQKFICRNPFSRATQEQLSCSYRAPSTTYAKTIFIEIVHRDLKLQNITPAQNPKNPEDELYLKISDFDLGILKGAHYERLHDRHSELTFDS